MNIFSQILKGMYIVYTKKKNTYIITKFFIRLSVSATSVLTTSTKNQIKEFLYFIEYFNEETFKDMQLSYCNMFF